MNALIATLFFKQIKTLIKNHTNKIIVDIAYAFFQNNSKQKKQHNGTKELLYKHYSFYTKNNF